jgi:hypothetical protein
MLAARLRKDTPRADRKMQGWVLQHAATGEVRVVVAIRPGLAISRQLERLNLPKPLPQLRLELLCAEQSLMGKATSILHTWARRRLQLSPENVSIAQVEFFWQVPRPDHRARSHRNRYAKEGVGYNPLRQHL